MSDVARLEIEFDRLEEPTFTQVRRPGMLKCLLAGADVAAILLAMAVATSLQGVLSVARGEVAVHHVRLSLVSLPVWMAFLIHYRLYSARHLSSRLFEFRRIVHAAGASVMATIALAFMAQMRVPRSWLVLTFVFAVVALTASREFVRRTFALQRRNGRFQRSVLVVGANGRGREISAMLAASPALGYRVAGFIDDDLPKGAVVDGLPVLGGVSSTADVARAHGIGGVLIASTAHELQSASRLAFELTAADLHVEICPGLCDVAAERLTVGRLGRLAMLYVEPVRLDGWRGGAKRIFDVGVAALGLLLTAPLVVLAVAAVRLDTPGKALFRQTRLGRDGCRFEILKLRTMVADAEDRILDLRERNEADGPLFKIQHDPRVTRVGRLLRKLSIDEIPQLWNVVRGEMSLVGPRPALPDEVAGWTAELYERLAVRPGITGMWQVSGRSNASFEDYTRLDLYYVHNWSLLTDLAMLAKTVPAVMARRGAC